MTQSIATLSTLHASRYLQQLCKHWAHRLDVTFDPHKGHVDFGEGQSVDMIATDHDLTLTISDNQNGSRLPRLEQVVADHLLRFAFKEELVFNWQHHTTT